MALGKSESDGRPDNVRRFAEIARDLAEQPDAASTMQRITALAVQVTHCDGAIISGLDSGGRWTVTAATEPVRMQTVVRIARQTGDSVSQRALATDDAVVTPDLATDERWPEYGPLIAAETGIRAALGFGLRLGDVRLGAMAFYSDVPGFFTDDVLDLAQVYADHATIALARAVERDEARSLQMALQRSREIGVALGILMHSRRISEQSAFNLLRDNSQRAHRKLREVAADVALTGQLPDDPAAGKR